MRGRLIKLYREQDQYDALSLLLAEDGDEEAFRYVEKVADLNVQARVAELLSPTYPERVLPLYFSLVDKAIARKDKTGYKFARRMLERIKVLHQTMGMEEEWRRYIESIRTEHKRKRNLMAEIREL